MYKNLLNPGYQMTLKFLNILVAIVPSPQSGSSQIMGLNN